MSDYILRLEHVTKKFGGLTAVDDLTMKVKEHEIHALIGPNGAGKTTATNMIEGVYPPNFLVTCSSLKI